MIARLSMLAFGLLLAACAAPLPDAEVRHVSSNEGYGSGRLHLFLFDPRIERPLAERIRLARRQIARDRSCRWIDAPRTLIEKETRRQEGELYGDTLLVAPLRCS